MNKLILAIVLMFGSFVVDAAEVFTEKGSAPFGLSWGMTELEVLDMGAVLGRCVLIGDSGGVRVCNASNLPANFPYEEDLVLFFVSNRLQKLQVVNTAILPNFRDVARTYESSDWKSAVEQSLQKIVEVN